MSEPYKITPDTTDTLSIVSTASYINVCAHCGECLKQFANGNYPTNIVLHYKDDRGVIKPWKPDAFDENATRPTKKAAND